jgi:predicted TIM-barrel fold metal-dependent hydrolase
VRPTDWIDCHFHVFRRPAGVSATARYMPAYGASFADWERAAPGAQAKGGVLVQTSFLGTDNDELLAELERHPETLRGVAVIDPLATDRARLEALHRAGVRGIRLNLAGATERELDSARLPDRLAGDLHALGWNVELHTDRGALPAVLSRIDPRLTVVIDHFGKPDSAHPDDASLRAVAGRLAAGSAAVHVKLSGAYRLGGLDPRVLARLWRDLLGTGQLLWGSDWPCTNHEDEADYPRLLAALDDWIEDAAQRQRILLDNPLKLYWR